MIRVVYCRRRLVRLLDWPSAGRRCHSRELENFESLARATPKGASVGGAYTTITNTGSVADRLVGGSSDVSSRFQIHEMSMDNGVMKMRPLEKGLEIKPRQTVELKPGGSHVMFVGLNRSLEEGQHVKATLQFEKSGKVAVDFTVEGIGARAGGAPSGKMQMQHGR